MMMMMFLFGFFTAYGLLSVLTRWIGTDQVSRNQAERLGLILPTADWRCALGIHDWDGHVDIMHYPAPRCRRCGRWHRAARRPRKPPTDRARGAGEGA